jgi:uncharacterized protein with ATP-grasp and redox domains
MDSFIRQCETAKSFLLLADDCGEIVLDKLFIEQLLSRFPHLEAKVMVRGGECDLFTSRLDVPRLTGILVEENSER